MPTAHRAFQHVPVRDVKDDRNVRPDAGQGENSDLRFKSVPFEVKQSADDGSWFQGVASPFFNIDSDGEIVDDAGFDQDLPSFMSDGFIGGLNHDWDNPIGTPMGGTTVQADGLHIKGSVIDTSHGLDVRKMLKAGVVKKLSIGYRTLGAKMLETAEDCMSYWQSKGYTPSAQDIQRSQYGARVLTRLKLYEVSPVTVPANDNASITNVKARAIKALMDAEDADEQPDSDSPSTLREYEKWLRDECHVSTEKAKRAVSLAKTLLRDVASGDAGVKPTDHKASTDASPDPEAPTPAESITLPFFKADDAPDMQSVLGQLYQRHVSREPAVIGITLAGVL